MKLSKLMLISILSVFLLVGCAQNDEPKPNTPTETPAEKPESTPKPDPIDDPDYSAQVKLSVFDVLDQYLEDFEGVELYKIELSLKDTGYVYELEGSDASAEHEVNYDAITGERLKYEKDTQDSTQMRLTKDDLEKIQNLFNLAHEDAGVNYRLDQWSLKEKAGIKLFEIELKDASRQEIEYQYNLDTGDLLKKD